MSSEKESSPAATPVWSTGPEQVEVEIVVTGEMYSVDVDIAKRMGIIQGKFHLSRLYNNLIFVRTEGVTFESPFGLTGCSSRDFERALTFCANDRSCSEPPSKELAPIIKETALPGNTPPESADDTSIIQQRFTEISLAEDDDDDDEEDGSYSPSESEASDSGDEYSDTDLADVGTANIKAERDEYHAQEKEKENLGVQNTTV